MSEDSMNLTNSDRMFIPDLFIGIVPKETEAVFKAIRCILLKSPY